MRALQLLLTLVALASFAVLGFLSLHVWWADAAAIEHLRRDVAYGWLLIQAAPLAGIASALALCCSIGGMYLTARHARPPPPAG